MKPSEKLVAVRLRKEIGAINADLVKAREALSKAREVVEVLTDRRDKAQQDLLARLKWELEQEAS